MKKFIEKYNLLLFVPLVVVMIASFFCMYQARFIKDIYIGHLKKQILWFGVGFLLIFLFRKIKINLFFQYSFYFYLFGIVLLGLVLVFGKEINGAKAWFDFKFFHFQPSEFVKIALLLYLVKVTNDFQLGKIRELFYIGKCCFIVLIPSILVFLEPDTGAIIFYLLILFSVFVFSGIKKWWFILGFLILILAGGGFLYLYVYNQEALINLIGTSFFYRVDRLIHFQDGSGMQLNNALITIGNASLLGHGVQNSMLYVPEFPTDFVFTLFVSIFGFVGGCVLLFSYFLMLLYFIFQLYKVKTFEHKLFIHGFLYIFLFQLIQNVFMNLGLLPIMGIPLPFLSYGGSNMIVYFIFLGFILNMVKKRVKN